MHVNSQYRVKVGLYKQSLKEAIVVMFRVECTAFYHNAGYPPPPQPQPTMPVQQSYPIAPAGSYPTQQMPTQSADVTASHSADMNAPPSYAAGKFNVAVSRRNTCRDALYFRSHYRSLTEDRVKEYFRLALSACLPNGLMGL